jgi:putative endonuclease
MVGETNQTQRTADHPNGHAAKATEKTEQRRARMRLGSGGERLAASWLEARGYIIRGFNWRCPYGELDVIAEQAGELVFVEVKTRRGAAMGAPEEAVTAQKQRRLIAAAQAYVQAYALEDQPFRIDVVAVQLARSGKLLEVRHYPSAVAQED